MLVFPNSKINLGLRIIRKREDGFHDLQTIFYPIHWEDALEMIPASASQNENSFNQSGISIDALPDSNLCMKAWYLLKADFPDLPFVSAHLHKAIPVGAGLGGGSADGAYALTLLNRLFNLELSESQLLNYAMKLGSDCPFFIINKPSLATGRGEVLQELKLDLSNWFLVMINPGIHISTGWAFTQIKPEIPAESLETTINLPIENWKDNLINDFEKPVFAQYPEIRDIWQNLYRQGAQFAALSGSGSTVYGVFKEEPVLSSFPSHYIVKVIRL